MITFTAYDSNDDLLPMTSSEISAAYGTDLTWSTASGHIQFNFFQDVFDVMPHLHGLLALNTNMDGAWVDPIRIKIMIDYHHAIPYQLFDIALLNPYITVATDVNNNGYEIHLPGYFVTDNFDQGSLIGTGDDDGTSYTTTEGYSPAIMMYGRLEYPQEQVDIITAYPRLGDYFIGGIIPYDENWWQPHPDTDSVTGFIFDREDLTIAEQNVGWTAP